MADLDERMFCSGDPYLFNLTERKFLEEYLNNFYSSYQSTTTLASFILASTGVLVNLVHLVILSRRSMRCSSINRLLFLVCICDVGTMLSFVFYQGWLQLRNLDACVSGFTYSQIHLLLIHAFLSIYLHNTSLWLVVTVALVRQMTLRHTVLNSGWLKPKCARILALCCFATVLFLTLPVFAVHHIVEETNSCGNDTDQVYYTVSLLDATRGCHSLKIHLWIAGVSCKILPCLLLTFLTVGLIWNLYKQSKNRRHKFSNSLSSMISRSRRERNNTVAVVFVVIVFILTEFPQGIVTLISAIYTEDFYFFVFAYIGDVLDLLSLINSWVNFPIYCLTSSTYRKTFLAIFGIRRKHRRLRRIARRRVML